MQKTSIMISPADHGRAMSLADFEHAKAEEGRLYELSRGVVTAIDVPGRKHLAQVNAIKRQIHAYDAAHPAAIHSIASGSECKILIANLESERHPDLTIYKTPPPAGSDFWARWIPEIVIEVVSPGGEARDYVEKREEYLQVGVGEYWILDAERREMLVLSRRGREWDERAVHPPEFYTTPLLPGLEFDCGVMFTAADAVQS